jgi:polyphosphate kinase
MNALQDQTMIDRLYEASVAGVKIELIVRGICCLKPGQPYSKNITITRIVDTFLEHARIWYFGNNGHPKLFCGSPDWMKRNLYRRIEAVTPVMDEEIKKDLTEMLHIQLRDNQKGCFLDKNQNNVFKHKAKGEDAVRAQYTFYDYLKQKNERS